MKNTKTNIVFVIGIIAVSVLIIAVYYFNANKKVATHPISCAIGDKFDIMTGKPCPPSIEEYEPATTTAQ